jgi:uncharacterized membrane protein|tara:strand:+ start:6914 stop:7303 length:390 start_codon:yes stop_codon:yes gene_type:complete
MNKEYTFLGLNMEKISILYGAFLIVWGLWVTSVTGSDSITSFIPSILGIPVITLSLLAIVLPKRKRLLMHIVVIFGLIILLGGLDFIRNIANPFENFWADASKLMMLITGSFFTYLCVKSFIFVRKNKQ